MRTYQVHRLPCVYAGRLVELPGGVGTGTVEDWYDRLAKRPWRTLLGLVACVDAYSDRVMDDVRASDDVVYAVDAAGVGHLLHISEILIKK